MCGLVHNGIVGLSSMEMVSGNLNSEALLFPTHQHQIHEKLFLEVVERGIDLAPKRTFFP